MATIFITRTPCNPYMKKLHQQQQNSWPHKSVAHGKVDNNHTVCNQKATLEVSLIHYLISHRNMILVTEFFSIQDDLGDSNFSYFTRFRSKLIMQWDVLSSRAKNTWKIS